MQGSEDLTSTTTYIPTLTVKHRARKEQTDFSQTNLHLTSLAKRSEHAQHQITAHSSCTHNKLSRLSHRRDNINRFSCRPHLAQRRPYFTPPPTRMAPKKTARVVQSAEMTEEERQAPGAAWEATVTKGMKETEKQMILQWICILMVGIAVYGYFYT